MEKRTVIVQAWEESERGWGVRPDGVSLHLNDADRETFIDEYWDRMPNKAPNEYSRPSGKPYTAEIDGPDLERLRNSKNGVRVF